MINPSEYPKLKRGATYAFQVARLSEEGSYQWGPKIRGRLLYAQSRKNFRYDDKGKPTDQFDWVAWRCSYEPEDPEYRVWGDQRLKIHSRSLEAGHFRIHKA